MCSELQCSLSSQSKTKEIADRPQSSSSALQLEDKSSERRHCRDDRKQSVILNELISSPKAIQSKTVNESTDIDSNCLHKVIILLIL